MAKGCLVKSEDRYRETADEARAREFAVLDLLESEDGSDLGALRAVLRIGQAALGAQRVEDVLEVVAEESLRALGAASFSISRWQRDRDVLQTLINVGELGPGEERWPVAEEYPLSDFQEVVDLLQRGQPYMSAVDDPKSSWDARTFLQRLDKECELAVPVVYESVTWGELWATGHGGRRFGERDVRLLQAIAEQVSQAIARAEQFGRVTRFAYEDQLTRLANRRLLDERLAEVDAQSLTLLACDVDGLKEVNDREGHPAGDALLRGVAGALSVTASAFPKSLVARAGGDEFCVLLPGSPLAAAERFARAASRRIAADVGTEVSVCWGAANSASTTGAPGELMEAADAALLEAKAHGPGRLRLRVADDSGLPTLLHRDRTPHSTGRRAIDELVPRVVELLDQRDPHDSVSALELLAQELSRALDAAAWSISATIDDGKKLRAVSGVGSELDPQSGVRLLDSVVESVYAVADFPATARALAERDAFIAGPQVPGSDPAELTVLEELGYEAVIVVGAADSERGYLLELYADRDTSPLEPVLAHARVLAGYCMRAKRRASKS
jgi:diguanylate cyclase (GGDEF)-like protein